MFPSGRGPRETSCRDEGTAKKAKKKQNTPLVALLSFLELTLEEQAYQDILTSPKDELLGSV
jgi:hypothetical protein